MLINRLVHQNVETLQEHAMLTAFYHSVATKKHFDCLVNMSNMLNVAAQTKQLDNLASYVDRINVLSASILAQYERAGDFNVPSDGIVAIKDFVAFYEAFWQRQTTTFYNDCGYELNLFYDELENAA